MENKHYLSKLFTRIANMIKKSYITLPNDDSGDYSTTQISYYGKATNTQTIYPYGLNANAPIKTLLLLLNNMGQEENSCGIPYTAKERFKNLKSGEVVIGSPKSGSYVKFLENGDIEIYTNDKGNINIFNKGIGFFGKESQIQQSGGALTAGSSYTANEQIMLNKIYLALQAYGLLS